MASALYPAALRTVFALGVLTLPLGRAAYAQPRSPAEAGASYEVLAVEVEGTSTDATESLVTQASGLRPGQTVTVPGDPALADAVRRLYELGLFSDVEVVAQRTAGTGVFLLIRVQEEPRLASLEIVGADASVDVGPAPDAPTPTAGNPNDPMGGGGGAPVSAPRIRRSERQELEDRLGTLLLRGRPALPSAVERGRQIILGYYQNKGFMLARVEADRRVNAEGLVEVTYRVSRGDRLEVHDVRFTGNEVFSERTLRKRLKHAPEDRWWRFWGRSDFEAAGFEEDLHTLVQFYNDRGYYGARVLRDTAYVDPTVAGGDPGIVVEVAVEEGPRYRVRNVEFEGNTLFTDDQLRQALGVQRGDVYDRGLIEKNLNYNPTHTDVRSLYNDLGYLLFNVDETVVEAPGDSLDLVFEVAEGDIYTFGDITIRGNTRTKDHVIRRELRTVPGQTFSRQALERSVRELIGLNYFDQTTLANGPDTDIDPQTRTVGLTYNLAEASSDQLELSGGYGGYSGLILQAGVTFNNFSAQNVFNGEAWSPLPTGDGQQLSLRVQFSGRRYQTYSLSFTEPWFRGRQTPIGFSLSYSRYDPNAGRTVEGDTVTAVNNFSTLATRVFYRQTLDWPDDFFQTGTDLGYRIYDVNGESYARSFGLPIGRSQELTIRQSLSRNSVDNPLFPTAGSNFGLSVTVAPPLPGFVQYHKWDLSNAWYAPLVARRAALSVRTQFGYIGSLTGDDVQFQRYLVGGSPLETSGGGGAARGFGKDLVYLRGYPLQSIGPRREGEPVGGRILNKYSAEFQVIALQTPQLSFSPYLFAEAANTYDSFEDYDPSRLYRSVGVGARLLLPILGLVDLNYGYGLDPFPALSGEDGQPGWRFQFSLGGQ